VLGCESGDAGMNIIKVAGILYRVIISVPIIYLQIINSLFITNLDTLEKCSCVVTRSYHS
jgi:hypothetical protein